MGRIESNMTISAEATIHRALADFAQAVYSDYGVRICDVHIGWCDVHIGWRGVSTLGDREAVVAEIEMRTMSRGRREDGGE